VKFIAWDTEKNEKLKEERGISFEIALDIIFEEGLITVVDNPNRKKYQSQRLYIIGFHGYAYVIPCIEDEQKIFLKTIYPSRKYTKIYIKEEHETHNI